VIRTAIGFLTIAILLVAFQFPLPSQQRVMLNIEESDILFSPYTVWREESLPFPKERITDPVNIVFVHATVGKIGTRLQENGWTRTSGTPQFLYIANERVKTSAQFAYPDIQNSRFHVRLFPYKHFVFGAVHLEKNKEGGGHALVSWEEAEQFLADMFADFAQQKSGRVTEINFRNINNDGKITLIDLAPL